MDRTSSVTLHFSILDVDSTMRWPRSRFVFFNTSLNIVIATVKESHRAHLVCHPVITCIRNGSSLDFESPWGHPLWVPWRGRLSSRPLGGASFRAPRILSLCCHSRVTGGGIFLSSRLPFPRESDRGKAYRGGLPSPLTPPARRQECRRSSERLLRNVHAHPPAPGRRADGGTRGPAGHRSVHCRCSGSPGAMQ